MSELELLFLVLACLYGWECACWIPRGSVALRTWLGRRWQPAHPGSLFGNQYGGVLFAPPLPPQGNILTGNQFPLSLSPEAALAWVASNVNPGWRPPQSGKLCAFDQMKSIETRGKKVLVNGELWLKAPSPAFAGLLARQLRSLQKAPVADRGKMIEKMLRDSLDVKALEQRWKEFARRARPIRWLTNTLFIYLFVAVPVVIRYVGLKLTWIGLLGGLLALTVSTAILFRRAHKKLYPDKEADEERFSHFLMVLLAPANAMRAQDTLSRKLLENFHPLALVRVFCSARTFREFAGTTLRELRFPALPTVPATPGAEAVERFYRGALEKNIEAFLFRNGLDPKDLMRPPAPADDSCRAYCPRCGAQFTTVEGTCSDCGGLPLVAFVRKG